MKRTLLTLALVSIAGIASAQTSVDTNLAPGQNPKGTVMNPNTTSAEAAVKSKLEAAGYTGVHDLKRNTDGTWSGRAMRNNLDIAVMLEVDGNIKSQ